MTPLLIDEPAPQVVRVLINRPDKRNAIDLTVRQALIEFFESVSAGGAHRAVILGGVNGIFSAGGDVPSMVGLEADQARERLQHGHRLARSVATLPLPVVAAIEGMAAGASLGLACLSEHVVIGRSAKVLFPFMKLGLIPDWGILHSLPQRVGMATARRLLLQARTLTGTDAAALGLADDVVDDGDVMAVAITQAQEYAALPLHAFAQMKALLRDCAADLEATLRAEEDAQTACLRNAEFVEGYTAFTEKRSADFSAYPPRP